MQDFDHPADQQATAKIYRFPIERRLAKAAAAQPREQATKNLPLCEFGSGWYHQAAVDAEPRHLPRQPRG